MMNFMKPNHCSTRLGKDKMHVSNFESVKKVEGVT